MKLYIGPRCDFCDKATDVPEVNGTICCATCAEPPVCLKPGMCNRAWNTGEICDVCEKEQSR